MNLKPVENYVVIDPDPEKERSDGGIIIPENAKIHRHALTRRGTVVSVGPGKRNRAGERMPLDCKVGDRVIYQQFDGFDHIFDFDGSQKKLRMIREDDLLGIIDEKPTPRTWQDERAERRQEAWNP